MQADLTDFSLMIFGLDPLHYRCRDTSSRVFTIVVVFLGMPLKSLRASQMVVVNVEVCVFAVEPVVTRMRGGCDCLGLFDDNRTQVFEQARYSWGMRADYRGNCTLLNPPRP